ncbi:MAG TPA: hypothetical protein VI793_04545 [Anaerolineales bacterium]|nr:hypothetical protein [Anaerolineales bacterium]
MKSTDRFLIGIVIGVVVLVIAAFGVAFLGPKPAYQSDDTPEGVAHNYLLAIQREDYARAYGYLSPDLRGYPASDEQFIEDMYNNRWNFRLDSNPATLTVGSTRITGNLAIVTVRETVFYSTGLFDSYESANTFEVSLRRYDGVWKVITSDSYWAECWEYSRRTDSGCR